MLELPVYPVVRTHLMALSDGVGIMQHAEGSTPDPDHGYCLDDVSRALQVDLLHARELGWRTIEEDAGRALRFLTEAFDEATGRFRNFRRIDGSWLAVTASEDCQGRALHALGDAIASAPEPAFAERARSLFDRVLPAMGDVRALRAVSSVALGCRAAIRGGAHGAVDRTFGLMADRLWSAFGPRVGDPWPWPEPQATYENGLPVRALIVAGRYHSRPVMVLAGLDVLEWLVGAQTAPDGHLTPIGNEWWSRDGVASHFDQQPIEATALMLAAETAHDATGETRWRAVMEQAYGWFLGDNDMGVRVSDPDRGSCHDGLTPDGVNLNQGAESTLMWLTALEHIRSLRAELTSAGSRSRSQVTALASVT